MTAPRRLLAYLRVSTLEQAESRAGLDAQRDALTRYVAFTGDEIVGWYVDEGRSGKQLKGRPALLGAISDLEQRPPVADGLVVAKLDRLARSIVDFGMLVDRASQRGWTIVCLDPQIDLTTATGRMIAKLIALLAEWERELGGERTSAALKALRAAGKQLGRRGELDGTIRARILAERAGGATLAAIADELNREGVPTAHSGVRKTGRVIEARWHPWTVAKIARGGE